MKARSSLFLRNDSGQVMFTRVDASAHSRPSLDSNHLSRSRASLLRWSFGFMLGGWDWLINVRRIRVLNNNTLTGVETHFEIDFLAMRRRTRVCRSHVSTLRNLCPPEAHIAQIWTGAISSVKMVIYCMAAALITLHGRSSLDYRNLNSIQPAPADCQNRPVGAGVEVDGFKECDPPTTSSGVETKQIDFTVSHGVHLDPLVADNPIATPDNAAAELAASIAAFSFMPGSR